MKMALKRRKGMLIFFVLNRISLISVSCIEKQSGGKPAKKKAPVKQVEEQEDEFCDSDGNMDNENGDFNDSDNEFDDMEDIPLETSAVQLHHNNTTSNKESVNTQPK